MAETPKQITSNILALGAQAQRTFNLVSAFKSANNDDYSIAGQQLKKIKETSRELTEERLGITRPMMEAKQKIMDHFAKPLAFLAKAEGAIKLEMGSHLKKVEAARVLEKKRIAKIEEEERLEKEKTEPEPQPEVKQDMTAEVVLDPTTAAAPKPLPARPQVKGVSVKKIWFAEVTDKKKLIEAVLSGDIPEAAIKINMSFLNNQAKALKKDFSYPGVEAKSRNSIGA